MHTDVDAHLAGYAAGRSRLTRWALRQLSTLNTKQASAAISSGAGQRRSHSQPYSRANGVSNRIIWPTRSAAGGSSGSTGWCRRRRQHRHDRAIWISRSATRTPRRAAVGLSTTVMQCQVAALHPMPSVVASPPRGSFQRERLGGLRPVMIRFESGAAHLFHSSVPVRADRARSHDGGGQPSCRLEQPGATSTPGHRVGA